MSVTNVFRARWAGRHEPTQPLAEMRKAGTTEAAGVQPMAANAPPRMAENALAPGRRAAAWLSLASGGVIGALAGAAAAIVAVLAYSHLNPPLDRRVDPLSQKLVALGGTVEQLSAQVGTTHADIAQTMDTQTGISGRLDEQNAAIETLRQRISALATIEPTTMGRDSPVFP